MKTVSCEQWREAGFACALEEEHTHHLGRGLRYGPRVGPWWRRLLRLRLRRA